jgi:hypothetical protein
MANDGVWIGKIIYYTLIDPRLGTQTRDFPARSIDPQPTTLSRALHIF